ncbi:hypothetical protein BHE74_00012436 [Ensete ventricosum]|uniref:Uncharacterized protein n=1 Tax=Ensete ventricosum TaxID=4639 RepID=A0A444FJI9_ENSVE|nr:hypothetical protein B296_00008076 [Ensete ventricosum]RWW22756.1 hypothetical protein GW17_00013024 [Ensete ventricosum]RWW79282.1 hypothetical protein BHE74_00012436 [Ensete ventricosum]
MKIQCDVCERAAAAVLCCADEAALCWSCDEKVHAANKLAGKHQRVPLLPTNPNSCSSQIPNCAFKYCEEGLRPPWPWNEILGGFEFDPHHEQSEPGSPDQAG